MFRSYLRRLAPALAVVTVGLLASAATISPAFAQTQATAHHHAAAGGLTVWQQALIGLALPVAAAALISTLRLVRAHRSAPSQTA
jgi:hypothetical protein